MCAHAEYKNYSFGKSFLSFSVKNFFRKSNISYMEIDHSLENHDDDDEEKGEREKEENIRNFLVFPQRMKD
jgi:hypothetical protein